MQGTADFPLELCLGYAAQVGDLDITCKLKGLEEKEQNHRPDDFWLKAPRQLISDRNASYIRGPNRLKKGYCSQTVTDLLENV